MDCYLNIASRLSYQIMVSPQTLAQIAQSAASDNSFLAAICGAYTEVGKNELERLILCRLPPDEQTDEQEILDGCDIVSDFFTVFG